jgi:hypothetical protein
VATKVSARGEAAVMELAPRTSRVMRSMATLAALSDRVWSSCFAALLKELMRCR